MDPHRLGLTWNNDLGDSSDADPESCPKLFKSFVLILISLLFSRQLASITVRLSSEFCSLGSVLWFPVTRIYSWSTEQPVQTTSLVLVLHFDPSG